MTRVCLVGSPEVDVGYELLSRETSRAALSMYDFDRPFENAIAVDTVSLGAAVSLLNDLDWYLVRFTELALVREPSVSEDDWLTRQLATAIRDGDVRPEESAEYLAVYGVSDGRLVEPMYVTPIDGGIPEYDLREVDRTVIVRVAESEFGG